MQGSLHGLNDDVLLRTFYFLAMRDMIRVSQVCRWLRTLVLATPGLWWDVSISNNYSFGIERFLEIVSRSSQAELNVTARASSEQVMKSIAANASRVVEARLMIHTNSDVDIRTLISILASPVLRALRLLLYGASTLDMPKNVASSLRSIAIVSEFISGLPVLPTVVEATITIRQPTEGVLAEVFKQFPRIRRLHLFTEFLPYSFSPNDDSHFTLVCLERLMTLNELRLNILCPWQGRKPGSVIKRDICAIIESPLKDVVLYIDRSQAGRRSARKSLIELPGPWTLAVRDAMGTKDDLVGSTVSGIVNICVDASDGRRRTWTLPDNGEAIGAAIRPLLLSSSAGELVLCGYVASGLAFNATERNGSNQDLGHVHTLRMIYPIRIPRKPLPLHGVRRIIIQSHRTGWKSYIAAGSVVQLFDKLPGLVVNVYELILRDVCIEGVFEDARCTVRFEHSLT